MKTSLSHLSLENQQELSDIVTRIKSIAMPEKIILFGSYATGKNVNDQYTKEDTRYDYVSDYDILILYKDTDLEYYEIEDKILQTYEYKAPLSLIILHIDAINNQLKVGDYFLEEMLENGVLLYDSGSSTFVTPQKLTKEEKLDKVKADFEFYFSNGSKFLRHAKIELDDSRKEEVSPNLAAYFLHQATESFYSMMLLVYSGYKPKAHNLDKFRKLIKQLAVEITEVFPIVEKDRHELYLFDLMKRAYISAKYKRSFVVSYQDVEELLQRVAHLREITKLLCDSKIESIQNSNL
ncbi:HEPN domain-containing protein [Pontibacter rugosus]|uniref:HEPN domain-containing protein n=1 Tax=Pontibacter rugosus TaxID=1745966 RepID=A0ABW3SKC3_9BACT